MEIKEYKKIGEALHHTVLENGLHVYVDVKPNHSKSFAFFATNYGGMDMRFRMDGQWHDTPAGVAHFLEHKMFDTEDGNALQDLAANGANPNAFTSSAITGYFFESTQKFEENLRILLSFVSVPYFTQESVDKEQGIIGQEIRMVEDDPDNQVYYGMLEGLYAHNPVRTSVAGTIESISHITAHTLYACHGAFYCPGNMVLCVAGNVDPEKVCAIAREVLPKEPGSPTTRDHGPAEKEMAYQAEKVREMAVAAPIFQLGFKADVPEPGEDRMRQELLGELVCESWFGSSTPLYADLYAKGLINNNLGYGYESYPSCAYLAVGGESKDPRAVRDAILAERERLLREGVDAALFERLKKAVYGSRTRSLNSFEEICINLAMSHFAGSDYFTFPECYASITKADVEKAIQDWGKAERASLSIVKPKEGEA